MKRKLSSALLSIFSAAALVMVFAANADAATLKSANQTSQNPAAAKSSPDLAVSKTDKTNAGQESQSGGKGAVVAKGVYAPGSSSKPYSPFSTNLSASPSPSLAQDSIPSSFGSGWSGEVLTYASNNLLNSSDPANADSPSVTADGVISFLEGKGITIATSAQTQITNEVNSLINTYNDRLGLIDGAPLARIFAIQIMCMKNTSTGQLVYPSAFPQDMLDKDYSSEYQSSWNAATSGKSYTLDSSYIWNTISYTSSDSIWLDPALTANPSKTNSGIYSLDQIEQNHLSSMKAQKGEINSLNLIGITQRAYAISTNPPSMSIADGYEESTGAGASGQTAGGMTAQSVVSPGSSATVKFTVETGPTSTSGLSATLTLSGASNAQIDAGSLQGYVNGNSTAIYGPLLSSAFSPTLKDGGRSLTLNYNASEGDLGATTSYTFSVKVNVTKPASNMAEVCSVAQGSVTSNGGGLNLKGKSNTWCFAVASISQKPASPDALYPPLPSKPSYISMEVPGWAFQYNGDVVNTLWSTLDGKDTSLSDYEAFQPSSPDLDKYSVNASEVTVTDLTTNQSVTSLFSSSYSPASSFSTGLPYSGAQNYGGYQLTPPSLTVSWNNSWTGSAMQNPDMWGYSTTPIGYDMFEVTFPLTLSSTVGGDIYTQSSTSGPATTFSSDVYTISTPLSTPSPSPISLTAAGIEGKDGSVQSSNVTATLGVDMPFEAEADFPTSAQISSMQAASDSLVFYSYDSDSTLDSAKGASVNGIPLSSLPGALIQSQNGAVAILLTPQDLTAIANRASNPSKLLITYNWYVTSAPSKATSEAGYVKGTSLSLSAPNWEPQFISSSAALTFTVDSNGTGPLTPNAKQSSALTGIWFQNQLLSGGEAKGAEFSVQNAEGQYLTSSSKGQPPYSYSSTPYYFSSTDGDGLFRIWGLADGTYTVTETKLPEGAAGEMPSFKVTLNYSSGRPSAISDPNPSSLVDGTTFMVFNQENPSNLPLTGGKLKIAFLCVLLPVLLALAGFASYRIYKLRS